MGILRELWSLAVGLFGTIWVPVLMIAALSAAVVVVTKFRRLVDPDTAMVVFGRGQSAYDADGKLAPGQFRIVSTGGTIVWPIIERAVTVPLSVLTITQADDDVITNQGVTIYLGWTCLLTTPPDQASIMAAARSRLRFNSDQMEKLAKDALSGSFREVVATMTPEEVLRDKERFQQTVEKSAAPEMANFGWRIDKLSVHQLGDRVGYYEALGAPQIAAIKSTAQIAEAEEAKKARVKAAQAKEEAEKAEIGAQERIAERQKELDVKKALYKREADTEKAQADVAYDLQQAETDKALKEKQGSAEVEKQRQAALAAEQAITVATKRAQAETVVPAEATKRAAIEKAAGEAEATRLAAGADAERTRVTKTAEADGTKATGEAEAGKEKAKLLAQAEGERELAQARAAMGEINLRQFAVEKLLEAQVESTRAVAQALAGIGANMKVVVIGGGAGAGGGTGNPLVDMLMNVPEMATVISEKTKALTGQDIASLLQKAQEILSGKAAASPTEETVKGKKS